MIVREYDFCFEYRSLHPSPIPQPILLVEISLLGKDKPIDENFLCLVDTGSQYNIIPGKWAKSFGLCYQDLPLYSPGQTVAGQFERRGPVQVLVGIEEPSGDVLTCMTQVLFSYQMGPNYGVLGRETFDAGLEFGFQGHPYSRLYVKKEENGGSRLALKNL